MGIKTKITKKDLAPFFKVDLLEESKNGVSDTVYFIDNKYVLKIFENSSKESVENELKLLDSCKELNVSKVIKDIFFIKNKPAVIYEKAIGESLEQSSSYSIIQIGEFLKKFHTITKNYKNSNQNLFNQNRLERLILDTKNKHFLDIYNSIDIKLYNNGIIHGDLFMDNCYFHNDILSCVFDFSDACIGDFIFDLAVVSISWCKNQNDIKILLDAYGYKDNFKRFKTYQKYALLYYCVTRYLDKRNYKELLKKIELFDVY